MKILKSIRRDKGFGLILALTFLVIMLVLMASTINWSTTESRDTQRSNQFVASQYAAEGAVENVLGEINYDFLFNSLSNSSAYVTLPTNISSWPITYIFSNPTNSATNSVYVNVGGETGNLTPLPAPYTGLQAFYQQCDVAVTATPIGQQYNVPATIHATILASQIPVFQYLIFYNVNLEINAAQTLDAKGPVFSNGGFWSGTPNVTFEQTVWAVSNAYNQAADPFANYTGSGLAHFTITNPQQPVSGVSPLTIPVAGVNNTNNSPAIVHKILEWPISSYGLGTANAYTTNGLTYLANAAGLVVSNTISGTNWNGSSVHTNFMWVYYQDSTYQSSALNNNPYNFANSLIWVTNDVYFLKLANANMPKSPTNYVPPSQYTNILYTGYSFLSNVILYDWREGWNGGSGPAKMVQAVQFDVNKYNLWLSNSAVNGGGYYNTLSKNNWHHSIGGVYIYTTNSVTTNLAAVFVKNGQELFDSYGLTIATPDPLYVQGDYNVTDGTGSNAGANSTTHARPAALLSDALSFLSSGWTPGTSTKDPSGATQTTLNAACLSGIVPSDLSIATSSDGSSYSGGVENFFRLLENWGGANFYYNGSIVVMFPSEFATNRWRQTGNYYGAPTRNWAFDTNFNVQVKLPPMTPNVKAFIRTEWSN